MVFCYLCQGQSIMEGDIKRCYSGDKLIHEQYFKNGNIHRENGHAHRRWNNNGVLIIETYRVNGEFHREDGPAIRQWNNHGLLIEEIWKWKWKGLRHTFGMIHTNFNKSYKKGVEINYNDLIRSGKIILEFMRKTKEIRRRYEKLLEKSIWWSFPGLGKILLQLNGRI